MILRKSVCLIFLVSAVISSEEEKKYDSNDWIPIAQPSTDTKDEKQPVVAERRAQGRVLNVADPPDVNFFPEEQKGSRSNYQQYLRETTSLNAYHNHKRPPQRHKPAHPYRFEGIAPTPPPPPPSPGYHARPQRPHGPKTEPSQNQYLFQQPVGGEAFVQSPPPAAPYLQNAQEYHTIPEEYLQQQGLQPANLKLIQQHYQTIPDIPDLPPIRLNASIAQIHAINQELLNNNNKKPTKYIDITSTTPKGERENVQLLYVPLEALNQKSHKHEPHRLHAYQQAPAQEVRQQFHYRAPSKQQKIHDIENDFIRQALEAHKLQQQLAVQDAQDVPYALPIIETTTPPPTTTTTTTRRPATKKRKPHQPPLAVYMGGDQHADVNDVLDILKDATTIDVQDSVGPNAPKIFVGPSNLDPPNGYSKFELPYLSSIDNNRVERKVDQLPFFVAPLSYKTPPGYSKIPLPSPHVGSVVVNNKQKIREQDVITKPIYTSQNQHTDYKQYQQRPVSNEDSLRPVATPVTKYSKPIPDQHVINQYEIDQINSFIPQYQIPQQTPEKINFDNFQAQLPPEYQLNYQQYQELLAQRPQVQSQKFKLPTEVPEILQHYKPNQEQERFQPKPTPYKIQQQKHKNYISTAPSPTQKTKQSYEDIYPPSSTAYTKEETSKDELQKEHHHKTRPLNAQEQFTEEVIPDDKTTYDSIQQTRNTHPNFRVSSTLSPRDQYLKEVIAEDNYNYEDIITQHKPTHIRTRPSTTAAPYREQYSATPQSRPEHYSSASPVAHYSATPQSQYASPQAHPEQYSVTPRTRPEQYASPQAHPEQYSVTPRTRPEQYSSVTTQPRPTVRRTRPTTTTTTTQTPVEQYLKETVHESRPTHTRQRQSTTAQPARQQYQFEEDDVVRYSVNPSHAPVRSSTATYGPVRSSTPTYGPVRSSTPSYGPVRSSTPTIEQFIHQTVTPPSKDAEPLYSPRPTINSLPSSSKQPSTTSYSARPTQYSYQDFEERDKYIIENSKGKEEKEHQDDRRYLPKQEQPIYTPTPRPSLNQHLLNQEILDSKILGQTQHDSVNYVSEPHLYRQTSSKEDDREEPLVHRTRTQYYTTDDQKQVKTQNANVENYSFQGEVNPSSQIYPNLINNLEDQSVRQLLKPDLVPNSERNREQLSQHYEIGGYSSTYAPTIPPTTTTTTTTTPAPTTEATTKRTRGRQRGRYSSTTPSSVHSTRRTTTQRTRRPLPSRTRYQESTTDYPARSTTDPTKRIVTARSRFRTRGRPTPTSTQSQQVDASINDRVSTTEKHYYDDNIRVSTLQEHSTARIAEPQVTHRAQQIFEDEYGNSYQPVYNPQTEKTHLVPLQKVLNVEISRPQNEPAIIQEINQLPIRHVEEISEPLTTQRPSRSRPRIRGRPRTSTTEAPQTTPRRAEPSSEKAEAQDEFYGFFREPNFKRQTTTPPPEEEEEEVPQKPVYSSTYISSTLKPSIQYVDDSYVRSTSARYQGLEESPIQFVGEIRPKYHPSSTAQYYEVTQSNLPSEVVYQTTPKEEPSKVKIRGRIRIPSRRVTTEESAERHRVVNEVGSREEASVRTPTRVRTRGKVHYKQHVKPKESSEDEDVEGGNYPPQFRVVQSTARPSFQITLDPLIDDQEPYASIFRPTYVAKESGSKDSGEPYQAVIGSYNGNDIPKEEKITYNSDVPSALPVISSTPEELNTTEVNLLDKLMEELAHKSEEDEETLTETTTVLPETTTKRRRGVWRLVKRPVESFESAESQHVNNVNMNTFTSSGKDSSDGKTHILSFSPDTQEDTEITTIQTPEETTTTLPTNQTEGGFFNSLYEMFGISGNEAALKEETVETTTDDAKLDDVTTVPQEAEPAATTQQPIDFSSEEESVTTQRVPPGDEVPSSTTTAPPMTFVTPMSLETWNLGVLKTSTSTEISHETEICYKGRCIKSKDMKVPMT